MDGNTLTNKVIDVYPLLCTGCVECEMICSLVHSGKVKPQESRIKVMKIDEEGINVPVLCQQCEDAPCAKACPVQAVSRTEENGAMAINYDKCIGCRACMLVCPFGALSFSETERKVVKCDLCTSIGRDPQCVKYCRARPEMTSRFISNPKSMSAIQYLDREKASYAKRYMHVGRTKEDLR